jgi:lysozyme family protein
MEPNKEDKIERHIKIINHVINNEGGYVNNPNDSGGETNFGITKRTYPNLDIENLTRSEAVGIYKKDFWDKYNFDKIRNFDVAQKLFDMSVNMGHKQAVKLLQQAHGGLHVDGIMGTITFGEINQGRPEQLLEKFREKIGNLWFVILRMPYFLRVGLKGLLNEKLQHRTHKVQKRHTARWNAV